MFNLLNLGAQLDYIDIPSAANSIFNRKTSSIVPTVTNDFLFLTQMEPGQLFHTQA